MREASWRGIISLTPQDVLQHNKVEDLEERVSLVYLMEAGETLLQTHHTKNFVEDNISIISSAFPLKYDS